MSRVLVSIFILFFYFHAFAADQEPTPFQDASGLFGYKDASGKLVIEPQYEKALPFVGGLARVRRNEGWSLINAKGKVLTRKQYHDIGEIKNQVAVVSVQDYNDSGKPKLLYGLISIKGSEVIEPVYEYFTPHPDNTLFIAGKMMALEAAETRSTPASRKKAQPVASDSFQVRFGIIRPDGRWVVPLQYIAVRDNNFKLFAVRSPDERWHVFTPFGEEVFKGEYTDIKDFDEEFATVRKDSRWGLLSRSGQVIKPLTFQEIIRTGRYTYNLLPMPQWKVVNGQNQQQFAYEFEEIRAVNEVLYSYKLEGRRGLMNEKGEFLTPPVYDQISPITSRMTVVKIGRKFGVIDQSGQTVLPNEYDQIVIDSTTALIKTLNGGKWGVYDKSGKQVLPLRYDAVQIQPNGSLVASLNGKWGTLDAQGNAIIPFQYQFISNFEYGKARAKAEDAMGVLDEQGNWLVEPIFADTRIINDSLCGYFTNGRCGIINTTRKEMRLAVDSLGVMNNGFLLAKIGDKYGLYDQNGREIIPIQYDYLSPIGRDSMVTVYVGNKKGLINTRGRVILKPSAQYQELQMMQEERVGVKINQKYGFIDKEGRLRIANRYEGITPFSENMAGIQIRGKWGFIDKAEALRVQPFYDEVQPFRNGAAMVRKGRYWGFTDRNGREVIKPQYDTLETLPTGRWLITKNGKKGLINEQGRELFIPKYDYLRDLGNGYVILGIRNKFGLYKLGNYDVVPIAYDEIEYNPWNRLYTLGTRYAWQSFTAAH